MSHKTPIRCLNIQLLKTTLCQTIYFRVWDQSMHTLLHPHRDIRSYTCRALTDDWTKPPLEIRHRCYTPISKPNVSASVRSIWSDFLIYAVFKRATFSITLNVSAATYINRWNLMNFENKSDGDCRFSFWNIRIIFHCGGTQGFLPRENGCFGISDVTNQLNLPEVFWSKMDYTLQETADVVCYPLVAQEQTGQR